jgi:dimethylaniline monooxygenase (N-oxide forming)
MDQEFDVVIIGAGLSGIAAAKFYLDIHPQSRLVVLEQDSCLGGVFSSRRIYPHFWTQWTVGQGEFSDMPMPRPPEEDTFYDFFKSKYTTQYLERYVDEHCFAGQSLRQKIIFALKVRNIRKLDNMWIISGKDGAGKARVFHTSKLMVASGLTSIPNEPVLPGKEKFEGPVLHQESFGRSAVLASGHIKNVTIIGGAKSAADMVYASVKAGKTVSWVFRTSGTGPAFFLSPKGKGPYKNAFEIGSTRLAGTVTPSVLGPDTWWTRFLHGTRVGNRIVDSVWTGADKETRAGLVAEGRDVNKDFLKLEPHTPYDMFRTPNATSCCLGKN